MFLLVHLVILALIATVVAWGTWLIKTWRRWRVYLVTFVGVISGGILCRYVEVVPLTLFGPWLWGIAMTPLVAVPVVWLGMIVAGRVRSRWRRAIYLGLLGTAFLYLAATRADLLLVDYEAVTGRVWDDGFCRQSTGYTCGPAGLAMLLHCCDISVTEREVAESCRTSLYNGTNEYLALGYLRERLGQRPDLWAELYRGAANRPPPPYLEQVEYSRFAHHWVVVVAVHPATGHYVVRDPLRGELYLPRERHEARSQHCFVAVVPRR